jgi:hypothetical protein
METNMRIVKKFAVVVTTAAVMGIGLLGSPAQAGDTSWGCGGCVSGQR